MIVYTGFDFLVSTCAHAFTNTDKSTYSQTKTRRHTYISTCVLFSLLQNNETRGGVCWEETYRHGNKRRAIHNR